MAIEGVKKSIIKSIKKVNTTVQRNTVQRNQTNSNNYANSRTSGLRYRGSMMRHRLQVAQNDGSANVVALRQTPNPYENRTASQIANEQLSRYENSSDKKQAAEETGRLIADIATYDPRKALEVANEFMSDDVVSNNDKDELAQEMVRSLDDTQLSQVAESRNGQILLRKMERNLLQNPVHSDEAADAGRIRNALNEHGVFLGASRGMYPEGNGVSISDDPNATPEQVADFVKYNPDTGRSEFIQALHAHEGDAEWLKDFYSALGTEAAGQLISDTVNPSEHWSTGGNGTDPSFANAQAGVIRDSLNTLQQSGDLTQDGMNALINAMDDSNPYVSTEIFGRANSEVREMFVQAAINDGDNGWDTGALHVLNTLPNSTKEEILSGLNNNQLNSFIEGAMAEQQEIISMSDAIEFGIYSNSDMIDPPLNRTTFGGVEKLLNLTAEQRIPYAPYVIDESPFSQDLQNRIFSAAAMGLNNSEAFNNLKDNVEFKDAISRSFIANSEDILRSQAPDGAFADRSFVNGMTKFFEMTLFTENGGELRGELMDNIILTMSDVGDASKAPPISQSAYEATHNGWSQQDHVEVMGGLMGMVWEAASNQKDSIQADITRREETTKLFIGMAFSFLPGAGDVIGELAGKGANFFQKLPDEVISFTWDKGKDLLEDTTQDVLLNHIQGLTGRDALRNIDALMSQFADTIFSTNATLPNGEEGELNLRTAFQSAFSFYKDLIDLP